MQRRNILKAILFVAVFIFLFASASKLVTAPADTRSYQWIHGFYDEPENSLDAVFIGPSGVYTSWIPSLAWNHYGISTWLYTSQLQPFRAIKYLIEETRKTQPDALYVISLNTFDVATTELGMHNLLDYMPFSFEKLRLIKNLSDTKGYSLSERMEYYLPFVRFHSRWNDLNEEDFQYENNGTKGGNTGLFLTRSTDVSSERRATKKLAAISPEEQSVLEDLFRYCESEQVKVLFVLTPMVISDEYSLARLNVVKELCEAHNFPLLDEMELAEEIGMDLSADYYNANHTNIHGAVKITDYISQYLIETYGFEDKRGDPAFESWDKAYDTYTEIVSPYVIDVEWEGAKRDWNLAAPKLSKLEVFGPSIIVSWKDVPEADGYRIYRKTAAGSWEMLATVEADVVSYEDTGLKPGEEYSYTVIAFRTEDGTSYWGKYDLTGQNGTAQIEAPTSLELHGTENDLALTWEKVADADGYQILRRVLAKSWVVIADTGAKTYYTDRAMLESMPYQYCVKAYFIDDEGNKILGAASEKLLWLPELPCPEVAVEVIDGTPVLSWSAIEGFKGYFVSRKTVDGDWEQISDTLRATCTEFQDESALADTSYIYRVTGYLTCGDETYEYPTETEVVVT